MKGFIIISTLDFITSNWQYHMIIYDKVVGSTAPPSPPPNVGVQLVQPLNQPPGWSRSYVQFAQHILRGPNFPINLRRNELSIEINNRELLTFFTQYNICFVI